MLIIIIRYKIKQKRKFERQYSKIHIKKNSTKSIKSDKKDKQTIIDIQRDNDAVLYNSKGEILKKLSTESTESSEKSNDTTIGTEKDDDAIVYNTDREIFENPNSQNTVENQRLQKIQDDWERQHYGETGNRNAFDKNYWEFRFDEGIISKKGKFLEAIEICEKNDLGSKAKIRRFKKKIGRWDVENERDVEALMPDYEYILDLIEKFETRE